MEKFNSKKRAGLGFILLVAVICMFPGCKSGEPRISIEKATAEFSPVLYSEASVYLVINNAGGKDTLTRATVSIPGATADFHEMRADIMVIAKEVPIPAKSAVTFGPGQSHIMIENLPKDMQEGSSFALTLFFKRSGEKQVQLTLKKAQAPMMHEHHM